MKAVCSLNAPRLDYVYDKACEFIVRQNICVLPADPFRIIENHRWGLVSYAKLAEIVDEAPQTLSSVCGAECATIFNGRNYCIVYDSGASEFARVVRGLFGEIGHIVLGHFELPGFAALNAAGREVLAREARLFALFVMAPSAVIRACGLDSVASLRCACGLTSADAAKRLSLYKGRQPCEGDALVRATLREYISAGMKARLYSPIDALFDEIRGVRTGNFPA